MRAVRAGNSADGRCPTLAPDSGRGYGRSTFSISAISRRLVWFAGIMLAHSPSRRWRMTYAHATQIADCPNPPFGHVADLVARHCRDTATVVGALTKHVRKLPQQLRRSLTWDRGKEMADHKSFTVATSVQVYFCDPHSPWQRGSNENTNGLLRQYFPRGTDLSRFSQTYLNAIALRLNQRPRKTLGFETPADRLRAVLQ